MATSSDFSVALHIGAHKTATSHLQRSLLESKEALIEQGVRYYGPEYLRQRQRSLNVAFNAKRANKNGRPRRTPKEQLAFLRKDGHRLVLSEENFIGILQNPQTKAKVGRYPLAARRITKLAEAMGLEGLDVFLSVRNPTTFLSSAYSQTLMGGRYQSFERFCQRNPIDSVDWCDLVSRVRAATGVRSLTVWRFEDYGRVFGQICEGLVGVEAAQSVQPFKRFVHRGLSAAAVDDVLKRYAEGGRSDLAKIARLAAPVSEGHASFDGFTPLQHDDADAAYEAQVARIGQMADVTLLRPGL